MNKEQVSRWLPSIPREDSLPIFCFSYAGGGVSLFRDWQRHVPAPLQICPIALPGREKRLREPPMTCPRELTEVLSSLIAPYAQRGFALYGHCFGASLAFEVALALQKQGLVPRLLAVSGCRAPHCPPPFHIASLPHEEFVDTLRRFRLTPETVLDIPDLLALFLPSLRADFALDEQLVHKGTRPVLSAPILVLHGSEDAIIPEQAAREWGEYSSLCRFVVCKGEHVFFSSDPSVLLRHIRAFLS